VSFIGLDFQQRAAAQRTGEEPGEIARLLEAVDRAEQQLDRPFRRRPFGFERIGEAEAADHEIGRGGAAAVKLPIHVLALAELRLLGQQGEFTGEVLPLI
jgi:hypothetical protein